LKELGSTQPSGLVEQSLFIQRRHVPEYPFVVLNQCRPSPFLCEKPKVAERLTLEATESEKFKADWRTNLAVTSNLAFYLRYFIYTLLMPAAVKLRSQPNTDHVGYWAIADHITRQA